MRKSSLALVFLICFNQQIQSQNRIGLVVGGVYAKSNLTDQNQSEALAQSNTQLGNVYSWYGGMVYDIKITNEFSIKTKLLYMNKGWTETKNIRRLKADTIGTFNIGAVTLPFESVKSKETYKFGYLQLPINFTFYTTIGKSLLSFGAGPYLSLGLSGRYNFKAESSHKFSVDYSTYSDTSILMLIKITTVPTGVWRDTTYTQVFTNVRKAIVIDSNNYILNSNAVISYKNSKTRNAVYTAYRFEYGASIEASLLLRNGFSINAGYTIGVTNVILEHYGALQNRHRIVEVGIGYYMRKKHKKIK